MSSPISKLRTWNRAKDCINTTLGRNEYFCNEWPERMGFDALGALQSMGDKVEAKAWKASLLNSDISTHMDHKVVCLPFSAKTVEYKTVSPDEFAIFLQRQQEHPSQHINAWFDVFGVRFIGSGREDKKDTERDLTKWMRETWINEGRPTGTPFFNSLKKYADRNKYPKSPIMEHWITGPSPNSRSKS